MATTRIFPIHSGKGRSVARALRDVADYMENRLKRNLQNFLLVNDDRRLHVCGIFVERPYAVKPVISGCNAASAFCFQIIEKTS